MTGWTFSTAALPKPFDKARAARTFERLAAEGYRPAAPPSAARPLSATAPFLAPCNPGAYGARTALCRWAGRGAGSRIARCACGRNGAKRNEIMSALRRAKRQAALFVALSDIAGAWSVEEVTAALTTLPMRREGALRFPCAMPRAARRFGRKRRGLEAQTGLIVLAMGKYGAFELNYSSDIDLIVFYDARAFPSQDVRCARRRRRSRARAVVRLLAEATPDGYVFRIDLRLRPDAGATQSRSRPSGGRLLRGMGQNWERAALIKARDSPATRGGAEIPEGARALRLARTSILRRSRTSIPSSGRSTPIGGFGASRSPATTSSSAAAASARSNSSCRRSSSSWAGAIRPARGRRSTRSTPLCKRRHLAERRPRLTHAYRSCACSNTACR